MKNKTILITGGCGFIGSNAALSFHDSGNVVVAIDDLSRKGSEISRAVLLERGIQFYKIDVSASVDALLEIIERHQIDVIIHAAGQVAVTSSVESPSDDFRINVLGTFNVLEAARRCARHPVVLFTSTNKVYGSLDDVSVSPLEERYVFKDLPLGIPETRGVDFHTPYGCSKGAADQYVRDWARTYHLPTIVFRQSCIYGPRQFGLVDQGWISFLTMQAFFDKPITIFGDGKQVRDVLAVGDLIQAMSLAVDGIHQTKGRIYNIGGGPDYTLSVAELVGFLGKRLNKKIIVRNGDWRPGDQRVFISDVRRASSDFSWGPSTAFVDGFETMFSWIEDNADTLRNYI